MDPKLFEAFTKKTRKREVVKQGPERCPKGHNLKMMKRQQLLKPNEEDDTQLVAMSEKECAYANCKYQEEGKNPPIDFLSEKYYACQFVYTCFYAVHADCYGGLQTYDMDEEE